MAVRICMAKAGDNQISAHFGEVEDGPGTVHVKMGRTADPGVMIGTIKAGTVVTESMIREMLRNHFDGAGDKE